MPTNEDKKRPSIPKVREELRKLEIENRQCLDELNQIRTDLTETSLRVDKLIERLKRLNQEKLFND